jgi:hypothetical protein
MPAAAVAAALAVARGALAGMLRIVLPRTARLAAPAVRMATEAARHL